MQVTNIRIPEKESIIARSKFIINRLIPIAIRNFSNNNYIILFIAHQDYDDSYIYLQMGISTDSNNENIYLDSHSLNINNIDKDKNFTKKDSYNSIIKGMNKSNVYGIDINIQESKDFPLYFHSIAVRSVDNNHFALLDIFYNTDNFIKLKLFMYWLYKLDNSESYMNIFSDKTEYFKIEIVNIETVKLNATKVEGNKYTSNYTMHCGPSEYNFNYIDIIDCNKRLSVHLDKSIYDPTYCNNFYVNEFFLFDKYLYVIYKDFKGVKALRLTHNNINKTNFVNRYYIFED